MVVTVLVGFVTSCQNKHCECTEYGQWLGSGAGRKFKEKDCDDMLLHLKINHPDVICEWQ